MNYNNIPAYPEYVSATTVLCRLMDGLAFRYYWATEGLTEADLNFRPCESSMNMTELLKHIYDLAYVADSVLQNKPFEKSTELLPFDATRELTLAFYAKNRMELLKMSDVNLAECKFKPKNKDVEFPFWHLINGPVADALTHVGQINSWRRMNGNPAPKHDPFLGKGSL